MPEVARLTRVSEASFSNFATFDLTTIYFGDLLLPVEWPLYCLFGLFRGWPVGCGVRVESC